MTALYLASGSPRRRELLTLLDVPFEVLKTEVEEQRKPEESAQQYVQRLAQDKAHRGECRTTGFAGTRCRYHCGVKWASIRKTTG